MTPKVRMLIKQLKAAGFEEERSRGSHRRFAHSGGIKLTVSGKPGADAHHYQVAEVMNSISQANYEKK
jgi:predicted RNA binding protein YcfA (HicA-like mRNA interferase family)